MKRVAWFAAILVAGGCGKPAAKPAAAPERPSEEIVAPSPMQLVAGANEVIVQVNNHTLISDLLDKQVRQQLDALGDRIPPDKIDAFTSSVAAKMVEQFVIQSLLADEAEREGIIVTDEDQQRAFERLRSQAAAKGKDLEEELKRTPGEKERMLKDLRNVVRIEKFLQTRLEQNAAPSDAEIAAFESQNRQKLHRPERVRARRIVLVVDAGTDQAGRDARRSEAESIHTALLGGASFEELARTHSDDPTGARGGDLGWVFRGSRGDAFDKVAFSQATGAVSPVVESPEGFEIIVVEARQEGQTATREQVIELMGRRDQQEELQLLLHQLMTRSTVRYAGDFSNMVPPLLRP